MTYNADAAVLRAKQDVGYHEGPNNYNRYSTWQGLSAYNPWCASFTCFCSVEGGGYRFPANSTFGYKGEAYTPTTRERAIQEGIWRDKHWRAAPGDHVLFDWANNGLIDHVELVIADDGTNIVTIGGNTSDAVLYRKRDRTYVAGFAGLSLSPQAEPPWKVMPMWNPAEQFAAGLGNPEGGAWMLRDNGTVKFVGPNGEVEGGMVTSEDRKHWGNRHGAKLEARTQGNGRPGYSIVATDGARYVPAKQK